MRAIFIYVLPFVLMLSSSCKEKKPDCSTFRTGKFRYHGSATKQNYIVERNDSIQTELVEETGTVLKFRIKWTGPCSYELKYIGVEKVGSDSSVLKRQFLPIRTTIISTAENYYVYKAGAGVAGAENSDTMRVFRSN